ncbi:MAG: acyl-CoA dehydrogenase family protein [Coriobacteriales bacterium]|jgi:alkylation response protein AidB-like acyl-CoA dehydrogenase|nr:acyl-CoA dehydrogenase family protein [Coriobacteriales bacterium]
MQVFTEEQQLMINIAKEFVQEKLVPQIPDIEEGNFPANLIDELQDLGFINMMLPEEYGGLEEKMVTHMAIVEEFAKENLTTAIVCNSNMISSLLIDFASDEQKKLFFPKYSEDKHMAGLGFTEPTAGSDAAGIQTTAVKDGDDWILNGQKTFVSYLNQCSAFLVSARTNETDEGGISTFLVEKDLPGVEVGSIFKKIGMHGSETGELFFKNVRVPAIYLIGTENWGLPLVLKVLDEARLAVAMCGVGIAQGALDKAVAYVKEREQFGRKISSFQGIKWYIAEMESEIAAARALVYDVANDYDNKKFITKGAAMAKWFASEVAMRVTEKAVQMCGGMGLVEDFGLERYFRDAKVLSITEGTSEILKIVIAREKLR